MFYKLCPSCDTEIHFTVKKSLNRSIKNNSLCKNCRSPYKDGLKRCSVCRVYKKVSDFYSNKSMLDGLQVECKCCNIINIKSKRQKNKNTDKASIKSKLCYKCKQTKLSKNFSKDSGSKDGFQTACKQCKKSEFDKWRLKNKDYHNSIRRKYYIDNTKLEKNRHKIYVQNNKTKVSSYNKKYCEENIEIIKQNRYIKYYEDIEYSRKQGRKNSRKRRARKQAVNENYTNKHEQITRKAFNNQCFNCQSAENLCIDHHRPLSKGNPLTLSNAVLLCMSCNSSKHNKDPEEFYGKKKCKQLDGKLAKIN